MDNSAPQTPRDAGAKAPKTFIDLFRSLLSGLKPDDQYSAPVEIEIFAKNTAATIYAQRTKASLLGSVLEPLPPRTLQRSAIHAGAEAARTANDSISSKIRVGEALREQKDALSAFGADLVALGDDVCRNYIGGLLDIIDQQICNIAVLGQMNSGKSSLINAFSEQPQFLPSEITPWTTVVTNLHFGVPGAPKKGAEFDFFEAEEWQRLAEGSARIRELTERLIPNFDWQTFYRQIGDMREKAEVKLGAEFVELLGKQHAFPEITPELLKEYVCAEPVIDTPEEAMTGRYSLITKAAHLYFDMGGFLYPTIVIDTPGINDPFLVRDEITRQNLERANIFIIVVTARQPLSNADVDLLRILRGLNKSRIIIFVNKIDEIDNFPQYETAIRERVRGVLQREFPDADIPIVMGSASWATSAHTRDENGQLPHLPVMPQLSGPEIADLGGDGSSFWLSDPALKKELAAEEVLIRSGVPGLALAISEMMQTGPISDCLQFSSVALTAIAINSAAPAAASGNVLALLAEACKSGRILSNAEIDAMQGGLRKAETFRSDIERIISTTQSRFDDQIETGLSALEKSLAFKLNDYVAMLSLPGVNQGRSAGGGVPSVNVMPLRVAIEQEFVAEFERVYGKIAGIAKAGEARLADLIQKMSGDAGLSIVYSPLPMLKLSPPLAALSEPLALAAGGNIQSQWWHQKISEEERVERFRALVQTQFNGIIKSLCQAASEEIRRATSFILNHFRVSLLHYIEKSNRKRLEILEQYRRASQSGGFSPSNYEQFLRAELDKAESEAKNLGNLAEELKLLAAGQASPSPATIRNLQ